MKVFVTFALWLFFFIFVAFSLGAFVLLGFGESHFVENHVFFCVLFAV